MLSCTAPETAHELGVLLGRGKAESQPSSVAHLHFNSTLSLISRQYYFKDIKVEFLPLGPTMKYSFFRNPYFSSCFSLPPSFFLSLKPSDLIYGLASWRYQVSDWKSRISFPVSLPPPHSSSSLVPFALFLLSHHFFCSFLCLNFYLETREKCSHWRNIGQATFQQERKGHHRWISKLGGKRDQPVVSSPSAFFFFHYSAVFRFSY